MRPKRRPLYVNNVVMRYIDELQPIPSDSKDNDTAAMVVPHIIEVNEILL